MVSISEVEVFEDREEEGTFEVETGAGRRRPFDAWSRVVSVSL